MSSIADQLAPFTERAPVARRRTAFACEACRIKKTKCDGKDPCSKCRDTGADCYFGTESVSTKGKSDVILNAILRVENSLGQLHERVASISNRSPGILPNTFAVESPSSESASRSQPRQSIHSGPANGVDNAIISEAHNSTTESILNWPIFDSVPSLRIEGGGSVFSLENSRPPPESRRIGRPPYITAQDTDRVLYAFQSTVNFSYPVISLADLTHCRDRILSNSVHDDSLSSCLALLAMALGCAAELVSELLPRENDPSTSYPLSSHFRSLADSYFSAALASIHHAYTSITTSSAQCLMLAALFYAYLQRPLQAWSVLSAAATKCRVLLSYDGTISSDETECIRRIFWSCFILESDYVSELHLLPHFGVAEMESSVPLPGRFETHGDPREDELSSCYFLACISMRRLLNRVHHLLFAKGDGVGVSTNDPRLPSMVAELDEQLTMWRDLLPPPLRFTIDTQPVESQHGAFLRQRYLVCKSLIYRPYLMSALAHAHHRHSSTIPPMPFEITSKVRTWFHACMLHILNLHSFSQTVMIDTWICSLSMAGTMAMILAAHQSPTTKECLTAEVAYLGPHLRKLLGRWMFVPVGGSKEMERRDVSGRGGSGRGGEELDGPSPSVQRAVRWIDVIDEILQREAGGIAGESRR